MKKSLKIIIIVLAVALLAGILIGTAVYRNQQSKDTATFTICLRDTTANREEFITISTKAKFMEVALTEAKENGKISTLEFSYGFVSKLEFLSNDFANNRSISIYSNLGTEFADPTVPTPDYVKGEALYLLNKGAAETPIVDGAVYLFTIFVF